jgi:hypothetical protein
MVDVQLSCSLNKELWQTFRERESDSVAGPEM